MPRLTDRRRLLRLGGAASAGLALGAWRWSDPITGVPNLLKLGETLAYHTHRLIGRDSLAPEFHEAELSPAFRTNGNTMPRSAAYQDLLASGFQDWRLVVDGLVTSARRYSLAELQAMPARTQITRHDCVEGWSAIGKWTGVPLSDAYLATTPGGINAVVASAAGSAEADMALIATVQSLRLIIVVLALPLVVAAMNRWSGLRAARGAATTH